MRTVNDAPAAIPAAHEIKPDLMLLDAMMPGMSGDEIAAEVRANPYENPYWKGSSSSLSAPLSPAVKPGMAALKLAVAYFWSGSSTPRR